MKPKFLKLTRLIDDESTPVIININNIEDAYPWDGRRKGTFINMHGSGVIVKEDISELETLLRGLCNEQRASDFVEDLINHLFCTYSADEYIQVKTILELLVVHNFLEHVDNEYYRRKRNEDSNSTR